MEIQLFVMSLIPSIKNWYSTNLQDVTRLESNAGLSTGDSVVSQRVVIELGSDVDLCCLENRAVEEQIKKERDPRYKKNDETPSHG
jgi:hypothetical protein